MRRSFILAAAAVASAVLVAGALAAKPPNGSKTGVGTVFLPNPVAELQNQSLTDQKDADYAALAPAYHDVVLTNLDGSGRLCGDWACIRGETSTPAYSPTNTFQFRRDDERFEQVMAYYWVTQAQLYLQSLGFGTTLRPINRESQDIRANQYGVDNSYSWDKHDILRFGKGGVDDAEDAEVILHEYGHAVQDSQQTPFGFGFTPEAGAIGEGFADYFAGTVSAHVSPTPDPECIADWDSGLYTDRAALPAAARRGAALPGEPRPGADPQLRPDLVAGAVGDPQGPRGDDRRPDHLRGRVPLRREPDDAVGRGRDDRGRATISTAPARRRWSSRSSPTAVSPRPAHAGRRRRSTAAATAP